mmetsp:Transcript_11436/g.27902  ORF Transcript_11436/g.27902 Transcript_11436/m.27902 type:complete len:292 (+) Transcript_11436:295-1170(+)|eukprot:CAMPEP_0178997038 /NCGR_PEP_ID=MMETSP0795-20121207/8709_1 /TAXON_ID=88552 /ORGANISM="Amoebophrya sp., Strain Ameob2" /LENGTH=291 /DNA_ID=CAMNT_0020689509 /DNA_START=206 /DNA_END=1081 /DNA_ORIENTATION=-
MPDTDTKTVFAGEMRDAMRNWVTASDASRHDYQAEGLIRMDIRHNQLEQRWHDLRFCLDSSIFSVKEKLHKHGAGSVAHMELYLRRSGVSDTIFLYDDHKTLREYGAGNDMELFIKDTDPYSLAAGGGLENINLVEKYKMTDEAYDSREKTLRNHVRQEREKNPNFRLFNKKGAAGAGEEGSQAAAEVERPKTPEDVHVKYGVGKRCECNPGGRRGTIKFVGPVKGAPGTWIGVELDEPQGMNDGSKDGERYFECRRDKYGCFSRAENVNVGDFPELDPFAFLEEEEEDEI